MTDLDLLLILEYLVYWTLFGFLHSLFASYYAYRVFKKFGFGPRAHRLAFNAWATFSLLAVLLLVPNPLSPLMELSKLDIWLAILTILLLISGSIIAVLGVLAWDLLAFSGLKLEKGELKVKGAFAFARHPVYTGAIIVFLSLALMDLTEGSLSWLLGTAGYFVIGSFPEERKLAIIFKNYPEYRENVGRFFPWKKKHLKYFLAHFR
ncbi:MAG: methyltransferase family protein [Candidatus Odinarchaeota archaeon]